MPGSMKDRSLSYARRRVRSGSRAIVTHPEIPKGAIKESAMIRPFKECAHRRLTTPSSATPGRGRGCEHSGARRRRGLRSEERRVGKEGSDRGGPPPCKENERQSPEFAAAHG